MSFRSQHTHKASNWIQVVSTQLTFRNQHHIAGIWSAYLSGINRKWLDKLRQKMQLVTEQGSLLKNYLIGKE